MSKFYSGSTLLIPLSTALGLEIDKCNFLSCQLLGCTFGYIFSRYLSADQIKPKYRHLVELILGVFLCLFCFGSQIWHLLAQSISVYLLMKLLPVKTSRYFILIFVLVFLSIAHIARMYYDYGSYTLDITGPLMVQTQKLSSLAFNLMDGQRLKKKETLKKDYHKLHAIEQFPTVLEFFSYTFYFHGLMVGPFVFFADYLRFIEGRQYELLENDKDRTIFKEKKLEILAGWREICFHMVSLICYFLLFFIIEPYFEPKFLLSENFSQSNIFARYIVMTITMFLVRQKYYIAWTMGSITNLFAGLGFSGIDKNHNPMYHIVKNFHFSQTEFGTSSKRMIDHWNVGTGLWLRECVYDRVSQKFKTVAVFACSAIWHGYYPGYYFAFASLAIVTNAGRYGRKMIRPIILQKGWQVPYDITTAIISMFCLNFSIIPFTLLDTRKSIVVWGMLYFLAPLGCIIIIIIGSSLEKRNFRHSTRDS